MKNLGIVVEVTEFEEGDVLCAMRNWEHGLPYFFNANKSDVEQYSGKGKKYLKVIITST